MSNFGDFFLKKGLSRIMQRIKTLYRNLCFFSTHQISEDTLFKLMVDSAVEYKSILEHTAVPAILSPYASLELLKKNPRSMCRFGDGEIGLIKGDDLLFQKYSRDLSEKLQEILKNNNTQIYVAIPFCYFSNTSVCTDVGKYAIRRNRQLGRKFIQLCDEKKTYLAAELTQVYQIYEDYDFEKYFELSKSLFEGKKIVLVHGKGILKNLEYNLLEKALTISYVEGPSKNAFEFEEELVRRIEQNYTSDHLICVILGPAAKSLVYRLTIDGYVAWDIGHWLKDYDAYKKQQPRTWREISKFFQPD